MEAPHAHPAASPVQTSLTLFPMFPWAVLPSSGGGGSHAGGGARSSRFFSCLFCGKKLLNAHRKEMVVGLYVPADHAASTAMPPARSWWRARRRHQNEDEEKQMQQLLDFNLKL